MMDMKEEMMSDAVDDVMDEDFDEEEEGDKILTQVLEEIGVDLSQQVLSNLTGASFTDSVQLNETPMHIASATPVAAKKAVALGESAGADSQKIDSSLTSRPTSDEDDLQARLDALRRG